MFVGRPDCCAFGADVKLDLNSSAHAASNLYRTKLAPLSECSVAILLEYTAVIKLVLIIKMVVKLAVNGNEFLQCLMTSKPLYYTFSSSKWQMLILNLMSCQRSLWAIRAETTRSRANSGLGPEANSVTKGGKRTFELLTDGQIGNFAQPIGMNLLCCLLPKLKCKVAYERFKCCIEKFTPGR